MVHRLIFGRRTQHEPGPGARSFVLKLLRAAMFFPLICYGWLLFRATSLTQIVDFTGIMLFGLGDLTLNMTKPTLVTLGGILLLLVFELSQLATGDARFYRKWPPFLRGMLCGAILFFIMMGTSNASVQFIYFQF